MGFLKCIKLALVLCTFKVSSVASQKLAKPYVFSDPSSYAYLPPPVTTQPKDKQKRFVLVPKSPLYGNKPMLLNQMEVKDLPPGDYEIVAMYDPPAYGFNPEVPSSSLPDRKPRYQQSYPQYHDDRYLRPPDHSYPERNVPERPIPENPARPTTSSVQYEAPIRPEPPRTHHETVFRPEHPGRQQTFDRPHQTPTRRPHSPQRPDVSRPTRHQFPPTIPPVVTQPVLHSQDYTESADFSYNYEDDYDYNYYEDETVSNLYITVVLTSHQLYFLTVRKIIRFDFADELKIGV